MIALDPQLDIGVRQAKAYAWYAAGYTQPKNYEEPLGGLSATLASSPEVALLVAGALVIGFFFFKYGR